MYDYLTVAVTFDPLAGTAKTDPASTTLSSSVGYVVWWCVHLPAGGRLEVEFAAGGAGPFITLARSGERIIGTGHVARVPRNEYPYKVRVVAPGVSCTGKGLVINEAQGVLNGLPELVCEPPEGPPRCSGGGRQ